MSVLDSSNRLINQTTQGATRLAQRAATLSSDVQLPPPVNGSTTNTSILTSLSTGTVQGLSGARPNFTDLAMPRDPNKLAQAAGQVIGTMLRDALHESPEERQQRLAAEAEKKKAEDEAALAKKSDEERRRVTEERDQARAEAVRQQQERDELRRALFRRTGEVDSRLALLGGTDRPRDAVLELPPAPRTPRETV